MGHPRARRCQVPRTTPCSYPCSTSRSSPAVGTIVYRRLSCCDQFLQPAEELVAVHTFDLQIGLRRVHMGERVLAAVACRRNVEGFGCGWRVVLVVVPFWVWPRSVGRAGLYGPALSARPVPWLAARPPASVLEIQTQHHDYKAVTRSENSLLISGHPKYCPEPVLVAIAGSTWGGSMLKRGFVGRGMRLEFSHPAYRAPITTSRIEEIRECPKHCDVVRSRPRLLV